MEIRLILAADSVPELHEQMRQILAGSIASGTEINTNAAPAAEAKPPKKAAAAKADAAKETAVAETVKAEAKNEGALTVDQVRDVAMKFNPDGDDAKKAIIRDTLKGLDGAKSISDLDAKHYEAFVAAINKVSETAAPEEEAFDPMA